MYSLQLLFLLLLPTLASGDLPACVPYQPSSGHWSFPAPGPPTWDAGLNGSACAWSTPPTLLALSHCMPGATLVFGGDSVVRYMLTSLGLEAWGCEDASQPQTPERQATCSQLYGLKERKGDAVFTTPPSWAGHNLTLHFRYLRFGYEFLDRAQAWVPDHLGSPAAADAILLGGMGYWDARYRTHDTLLNILQRLGEDMAPLYAANPTLRAKLTVLSTTYSENYGSRMAMFPHDILDAINAAAAPVWRAMGVPWFDVTRYVRAVGQGAASADLAGRMASSGGKLLTQDGYHPILEVQQVILREVFSHMCETHRRGGQLGSSSSSSSAGSRRDRLVEHPLGGTAAAAEWWGGLGTTDLAGLALLALLSCGCCLSGRGRRCRRRCCTGLCLCCGCLK